MAESGSEAAAKVSRGNFPNGWTDTGYTVPVEELPIVVGVVGVDGKVRVDERELEPGRYRVRAGAYGDLVGEIEVTDPQTHFKTNRADRRKHRERNGVYARKVMQRHRWGRD